MRAEGFTRWDAFLQLNFHPRKQVNPLMTQEQEQQLSQTMLAMMQSGGDAPKSPLPKSRKMAYNRECGNRSVPCGLKDSPAGTLFCN